MRIREKTIFNGYDGWTHDGITFRLACAPDIMQAPNGDLLVTWLTGSDGEPAGDNCVAMLRSADGGKTWAEPVMFVPPGADNGAGALYTVGGHMVAMFARWPLSDSYTVWHYSRGESYDNGHTWQDIRDYPLTTKEGFSISLSRPIYSRRQGGWIFCASTFQRREKPLIGSAYALSQAKTEEEAARIVSTEQEDRKAGKFGTHLHGCGVVFANDDMSAFTYRGGVANRPMGLLEPTIVELSDGRLVMLMRAEWGGFLWRTESADGGYTWTPAVQTEIRNPTTKPFMMRLSDGRIVLVHNDSGGEVGRSAPRDPLSVWVSDDELQSFSVKEDIITGGKLAYPDARQLDDGRIVMVYDRDRRTIEFVEVELDR